MNSRAKLFIPLILFFGLTLFLFRGLFLDPKELPSARIGHPVPTFELPLLANTGVATPALLKGQPTLLNVWATWCYSCRVEHPYLLRLAASGVNIIGHNYKDEDSAAAQWLADLGNPYSAVIADHAGTFGLDLGVYGAPETYVVDADGIIRYRHVGVVDERVWSEAIAPFFPGVSVIEGNAK